MRKECAEEVVHEADELDGISKLGCVSLDYPFSRRRSCRRLSFDRYDERTFDNNLCILIGTILIGKT